MALVTEKYQSKFPDYYTGSTEKTRTTGIGYDKSNIPDISRAYADIGSLYQGALSRFTDRLNQARTDFTKAESPLQENIDLFRPGGGYGAGQHALIDEEARKALGAGRTSLVASGMASGSSMANLETGVGRGATTAMLGVEDVRTENLSAALNALANLRGAAAGSYLSAQEPGYEGAASALAGLSAAELNAYASLEASQMGAEASMYGSKTGASASMASSVIAANASMANANTAARAGIEKSKINASGSGNVYVG